MERIHRQTNQHLGRLMIMIKEMGRQDKKSVQSNVQEGPSSPASGGKQLQSIQRDEPSKCLWHCCRAVYDHSKYSGKYNRYKVLRPFRQKAGNSILEDRMVFRFVRFNNLFHAREIGDFSPTLGADCNIPKFIGREGGGWGRTNLSRIRCNPVEKEVKKTEFSSRLGFSWCPYNRELGKIKLIL